ncbi:GNAT family N-acetyltransferase [Microbacterium sp. cx-59]|uniref:GNAT family N-acetyltransferase n=1 Tax=Microbacterium sp. cx-59 TaxID=2891207 RepID=UPI001E48DE2A|nr:GNAT family N-acetyltransferase [Microbacterium sp. cx-59]MCC4909496.1 GNAT family N-acetyltransferase [Microbacterium sp. cx-59]
MPVEYHRAPLREIAPETLYRILWLRVTVFVVEQEAAYPELDGRDLEPDAELLWAEDGAEVVATLRVLHDGDVARIGRVATAASARGQGIAARLMERGVARCEERWPQHAIVLDAQQHLGPWYARFGFVISGEPFSEDGIPHVPMRRPARA